MKYSAFSVLAAAAIASLAAAPAVAQKKVRDGIEAWQNRDYAGAVAIWLPLAEKGNADAAFNLGQAYRLGRGVDINLAKAQSWLEKAARAGHLDAQTTLGLLLFDSGNRQAAMRWLKQAAERGEPRAMLVYGTALFNGDGVPRDPVMAYAYISRSAAQGLEPAKSTLEQMDQLLPVEVRQKGVAIALKKANAPKTTVKKAPAKSAANQVREKPAEPAPAVAAKGDWRIQLGAFSKRESAESLYDKLSGKLAGHKAFYVSAGGLTRLQVGPYPSNSAATAACESLKGQPCFPVEAK
ncbi:MAG TPA: SPOR domain-containing protein [Sphingomicrobium sp.]|jgi:TPR repeat protein|nr:SPOR domain-containing protein [Sphingomicrobium sp.]